MIQFYRGLRAKYTYPEGFVDAIYFATDSGEILVNGISYGIDQEKVKGVTKVGSALVFTMANDTTSTIDIGIDENTAAAIEALKGLLDENGQLNISLQYQSKMDDSLATITTLGGIAAGTTAGALKKKTLSEVFDDLLFPTVQPTITGPSASLSLKTTNIREVGSAAPAASEFNASFSQGTIKIGSATQNPRAGAKTSDSLYIVKGQEIPTVVALGTTNYYYEASYAAGAIPKDSKGNPATNATALPEGSVKSGAVPVYGVYPFYANVANETVTRLPLTKDLKFKVSLAAEGPNKHVIKIPHTITKFELLNTLSGKYELFDSGSFNKTTEEIDVNGTSVTYNVYTRKDSGFNGASEFQITYSK